ncbi:aldehyde dehydrogenase family protein [Bosea sp. NPDC055594]
MTAEAVEDAIARLAAAAAKIRATSSHDRAAILDKMAVSLAGDLESIAQALAEESGYLSFSDMKLEVQRTVEVFQLAAAYARVGMSEVLNVDAVERARGAVGYIRREPIGPILGITAYNGPLLIPAHKLAPAVAAGAPLVLKPSPRVPRAAIELAKRVVAAGWPAEAVAVLDLDNDATMALVCDERLPIVSFTGGEIGWTIKDMVPRKHVHLELGGIGAVLIAADANLDQAARECAAAGFVRSGQSCISVQRIYVEQPVYQAFVEKFVMQVAPMQIGGPAAISPMVDAASAQRVKLLIDDAVGKGAKLACGGTRSEAMLEPTVLLGATAEMTVMRKEAFGPIVAVSPVASLESAIDEINAVSGSIHHGIYTASIDAAFHAADRIRAGGVIINGPATWRVDHMPYGGTGTSGFGREGIRYAVEQFTEPKVIIVRPTSP